MSNPIAIALMVAILEGITIGMLIGATYLFASSVAVRLNRRYASSRGAVESARTCGASSTSASSFAGSSP